LDSQGRLLKTAPTVDAIGVVLQEYQRYLTDVRGFSASTVEQHGLTIYEFLSRARLADKNVAALTRDHVERYVALKSKRVTRQALQNVVARLRGFLRYAHAHGMLPKQLDTIDTPRAYRGELPPRAMPWPLVLRLLSSVDRSDGSGWRDYTILHFMAYYGLRSSEVVSLAVDSIDWNAKTCLVEQRKTHSTLVLPLSNRTLMLVRRYLRHGRPKSTQPQLFLREHRPATGMGHHAIGYIFRDRVRQSGLLPLEGYSTYCLRHAFAMRLLQRGVGVKTIGDLLGHHTLESTYMYLRLNISMLRDVGLPLPRTQRAHA
jgi:site-specific recombinase XerD